MQIRPNLFFSIHAHELLRKLEFSFAGSVWRGCQWVLDAVRETVEWLSQPLGFESLALLSHSTDANGLDNSIARVILKLVSRTAFQYF